jgi:hypothetical protein
LLLFWKRRKQTPLLTPREEQPSEVMGGKRLKQASINICMIEVGWSFKSKLRMENQLEEQVIGVTILQSALFNYYLAANKGRQ